MHLLMHLVFALINVLASVFVLVNKLVLYLLMGFFWHLSRSSVMFKHLFVSLSSNIFSL